MTETIQLTFGFQGRPLSKGHWSRGLTIGWRWLQKCLRGKHSAEGKVNTEALRTSGLTPEPEQRKDYIMHKTSKLSARTHSRKVRGEGR